MSTHNYVDYALELLSSCGNIRARKMFGGHGIYQEEIFFALIIDSVLYFKVSDCNQKMYKSHGSKPFSYEGKNKKIITMSYWQVPIDILENNSQLVAWIKQAVEAARQAKAAKKRCRAVTSKQNGLERQQ